MHLSELIPEQSHHSLPVVVGVGREPVLPSQETRRQIDFLQMVQWTNHHARVLACCFIGCLSHIDWFKSVLAPKLEQLLGHTKRCAQVVHGRGLAFAQFLQNGLHTFLRLDLFFGQPCRFDFLFLGLFAWGLELHSFIY